MPVSALKAGARGLIFMNFPWILFFSLLYVVFISVIWWLSYRLSGSVSIEDINSRLASGEIPNLWIIYTNFRPTGVFFAFLLLMLLPFFNVGFISVCIKTYRSQKTEFKELFKGFLFFTKVISIFIISAVFIFLWSLLLIFPGIVAGYKYRQAYYILLEDPEKGALSCISESKQIMHGKKLDLFILDLSFAGWYFLRFILMLTPFMFIVPLLSIWLSPYAGLTRASFYENLIADIAV